MIASASQPLEISVHLLPPAAVVIIWLAGDHLSAIGTILPAFIGGKVGAHQGDPASSRPSEPTINENTPPGTNRERGELVQPLVPHH